MVFLATTVSANTLSAPVYYPTPKTTEELIVEKSAEYKVSADLMRKIIHCESSGNPNAVGDYGNSFGLVQIYLPAHPTITKEQALDKEFAVSFLAKGIAEGYAWWWTCYSIVT